jgi:hypothetical protein
MDSILHVVLGNALVATVLALLAAGSTLVFRRPALSHALWTLVLLKLITPSFIQVPIPGYTSYRAAESANASPAEGFRPVAFGGSRAPQAVPPSSGPSSAEGLAARAAASSRPAVHGALPATASPWSKAIFWLSFIGGLAWFTWVGLRIRRFHGLLCQTTPAPAELVREVELWARRIGLRRCPQVLLWRRVPWFGFRAAGQSSSCRKISSLGWTANSWPRC